MSYTASEIKSIKNMRCIAYYNNVFLGVFEKDAQKFIFKDALEKITADLHGESAIGYRQDGNDECSFECKILSYNKHIIKNVNPDTIKAGTTATALGTPYTGALKFGGEPQIMVEYPLVIYPVFIDETGIHGAAGTRYSDTIDNPLAILIPKAIVEGGLEKAFGASTTEGNTIKFHGVWDITQACMAIQDDGITSAGVYTP